MFSKKSFSIQLAGSITLTTSLNKRFYNGASFSAYTFIRLNGAIKLIFHDWLYRNFPDRAEKVWGMIEQSHDGKVNDSRWGVRMRGEGHIAELVAQHYKKYGRLYGLNAERWDLDCTRFSRPGEQGRLFI